MNKKAGARTLKMHIDRENKDKINLKRISRIKRKFGMITKIRKKTKLRTGMKEMLESNVCKNILNQSFKTSKPRQVFSTDVTYLTNSKGQRAYLSGVKDLCTREIVGFEVSRNNDIDLVIGSLRNITDLKSESEEIIIHSDQGHQYISHVYQNYLRSKKVTQSMSRRGNCYDNAPIESFFGHMKDECDYKDWTNIKELKRKIRSYMSFYNEKRPQWSLKRKTPVEYRSFLS